MADQSWKSSLMAAALMGKSPQWLPPLPAPSPLAQALSVPALPPPLPRPRPPTVFDKASAEYPILKSMGLGYTQSPVRSDAMLEFWPPGEPGAPDMPRPRTLPLGQPGIEVYSDKVRPIDIMGDVASHYMVTSDPVVARTYKAFTNSLQPWQEQNLRGQYEYARKNEGERRSYSDWKERSGVPAYFRGYAFQQWGDDASQFYTPEQLQILDAMMGYLKRAPK